DINFGAGKWLSLFQHHGFKTRFLDWTKEHQIALMFLENDSKTEEGFARGAYFARPQQRELRRQAASAACAQQRVFTPRTRARPGCSHHARHGHRAALQNRGDAAQDGGRPHLRSTTRGVRPAHEIDGDVRRRQRGGFKRSF
ncbi:MAG: FRG domain-containing protein, partial [Planctomycetes bacterium]|nr:FRG domain-containing protein [Planctomycetota bacterium]